MTDRELMWAIEQARAGGGESVDLEFKRSWWAFDQDRAKAEFRKDVAAMGNAHAAADRPRHIVVGVDGATGTLFDAPLPVDEARLQEVLKPVTPRPRVRVDRHLVEGMVVSVIVVEPPFDRPYTVAEGDRDFVYLRRGSAIGTAGRRDLDAMYESRRRVPRLAVRWQADDQGDGLSVTLPRARLPVLAQAREILAADREQVRADLERWRDHGRLVRAADDYFRSCERFMEEIATDEAFEEWYARRHGKRDAVQLSLVMENAGTAPATDIRLVLQVPEWLRVTDVALGRDDEEGGFGDGAEFPERPDFAELERRYRELDAALAAAEMHARLIADSVSRELMNPALTKHLEQMRTMEKLFGGDFATLARVGDISDLAFPMGRRAAEPEEEPSTMTVGAGEVVWEHNELLHDHEVASPGLLFLLPLPGAPIGDHELVGTVFHRELERREQVSLRVRVVPAPTS